MKDKVSLVNKVPVKCGPSCYDHRVPPDFGNGGFISQVKSFFAKLFDTADWPARWHCGNWSDFHGWLYILSDIAIWAAYFAIPFLLFRIISKRKDIPFPKILWLFIGFILLCGTTHLLDAIIIRWPAYRLSALVRLFTAIISVFTVFALYRLLPMIYRLRTLDELEAEIEERKRAEEQSRHQQVLTKAAEDLMAKKDEFMSIASHELKTPITTVKASLQVLERILAQNDELAVIAPFVHRSSKQINKLTSLIDELLDVTRIQAGQLQLHKEDFNIMKMAAECVEQCQSVDGMHQVTIQGDENLTVFADYNRIDQVLCNFLTNAFKYSPEHTLVEVNISPVDNGKIKLSVADRGIGIPDDKKDNIFDRFFRVENTSHKYSGIGLGLYISSQIIAAHGGQIGVTDNAANGTIFWFII
jgi:signal transduction histidine kinase